MSRGSGRVNEFEVMLGDEWKPIAVSETLTLQMKRVGNKVVIRVIELEQPYDPSWRREQL